MRGPPRPFRVFAALVALAAVGVSHPVRAVGTDRDTAPQKQEMPVFTVSLTDGSGTLRDSFDRRMAPHVDMSFVLALSASSRYATSITVIQDANGKITEDVLFEGSLEEGIYRFRRPLPPPAGEGEIRIKVIMKTRLFLKKFTGESIYVYRNWEGSYHYGK